MYQYQLKTRFISDHVEIFFEGTLSHYSEDNHSTDTNRTQPIGQTKWKWKWKHAPDSAR